MRMLQNFVIKQRTLMEAFVARKEATAYCFVMQECDISGMQGLSRAVQKFFAYCANPQVKDPVWVESARPAEHGD